MMKWHGGGEEASNRGVIVVAEGRSCNTTILISVEVWRDAGTLCFEIV